MSVEQRVDMEKFKAMLKAHVSSRMTCAGDYETGLSGVRIHRKDETTRPTSCVYRPVIIKMLQGCKKAVMGNETYQYGENEVMVTGVDMPGLSMLCEASPETPSLSISIDLDENLIAQLAMKTPYKPLEISNPIKGVHVQTVDKDLLDAFLRLAELFDKPERLAVIGPLVVREIHYLLLTGPNGHRLRFFHTNGFHGNRVARVISWLKQNLSTTVQIEDLAEKANMAPSTFHRHFKEVTTLSPLQYQKRLRLHEAQRLMLVEALDAGSAAMTVGYESVSQFNREYKRLFGEPPRRNVQRLKTGPSGFIPPSCEKALEIQSF